MSFSYSGSVDVSRGIAKVFMDETYYSFQTTEKCRIGVDGQPLVWFKDGEEFIIKLGATYIFDRDTTISLSYPISTVLAPTTYEAENSATIPFYSTSGYGAACAISIVDALTAYTVVGRLVYNNSNNSSQSVTIRIIYDSTILASQTQTVPASSTLFFYINKALTTTIPANKTVRLEAQRIRVNNGIVGGEIPSFISITDTA